MAMKRGESRGKGGRRASHPLLEPTPPPCSPPSPPPYIPDQGFILEKHKDGQPSIHLFQLHPSHLSRGLQRRGPGALH
ncbi:hypothetical protein NQZ68_038075 [Dissostichus eleginoides]|nr:hypothetical protein NQZ68_038075 [Dissostichus eleginoides]